MDSTNILGLLEQLDDEIDDLQDSLATIRENTLSDRSSKLPLLDKAKLYVLTTYAIESILFSYLRLNGIKAREHPVFKELTRVKQYFDKIKTAETPITKRDILSLDKHAAGRIIQAGLSGNDRYDLARAEQQAKEKARAHIRFEESSKKRKAQPDPQVGESSGDCSDALSADSEGSSISTTKVDIEATKKQRLEKGAPNDRSDSKRPKKKRSQQHKRKAYRKDKTNPTS